MTYDKYFKTPGGIKKFQETSGIAQDVSSLSIRQIIKRKHYSKKALANYNELFSNWKKRLAYQRFFKATIDKCNKEQQIRREKAIEHYYSLPPDQRTSKNWIKYTSMFSGFREGIKGQDKLVVDTPDELTQLVNNQFDGKEFFKENE